MSATENDITCLPPHVAVPTDSGVAAWRAVIRSVEVIQVQHVKHLVVREDGEVCLRLPLTAEAAGHLASQLSAGAVTANDFLTAEPTKGAA